MAYSKSPKNKFAPSTVVSMASMTSNRPMSYGQVYENLNYEMSMHKISDTDRKWMASRKNFINSNKRAFEELQIKVGNLIEAGKIPPNFANNLDKICTDDEFNSIQAEVNRMESSRAIDRTGHFHPDNKTVATEAVATKAVATGKPENTADATATAEPENTDETVATNANSDVSGYESGDSEKYLTVVVKNKKPRKKRILSEKESLKKDKIKKAKEEKDNAHKKLIEAYSNINDNEDETKNEILEENKNSANIEFNKKNKVFLNLIEPFNNKVKNEVNDEIQKRKDINNTEKDTKKLLEKKIENIKKDVAILENADKILLQNIPGAGVIEKLGEMKENKIKKIKEKIGKVLSDDEKRKKEAEKEKRDAEKIKREAKKIENKTKKENITETEKIKVQAAKELAVKDGLLIRTVKGKYIPNINKNDIGTLRKVYNKKKSFTISGHVRDDITVIPKNANPGEKVKYVLRKNKVRAANNNWSESLKLLKGNVKMVGPDKFNEKFYNAKEEDKKKLLQNLDNYITVMDDYIKKLPNNDATKITKQAKLNEAKSLNNQHKLPPAQPNQAEQENVQQDAQRLSAMDRDYRQSFQAASQKKPFKADRYKLGSSDMHDWPSSAGSSVSSNRDSWYAEWNANRSY